MPAAKLGPEVLIPQSTSNEPKLYNSDYRHNLIDTSVTPLSTIITQIGGYPLIVDWYSQNIGRDMDVDGFNQDLQTSPLQQYTRTRNVKIKLSSPMNYQMNGTTSTDGMTGDAKIAVPGIVPKEGDVFLADIGQGRLGLFTISNPLGLSQYDGRANSFDFILTAMATTSTVADLDARVTRSLNYVEEFIVGGQNPLITDDDLTNYNGAQKLLSTLTKQFMAESFSHENSTLTVPGQYEPSYDPYLTNFVMDLIEVDAHPNIRKMKRPNVDDFKTTKYIDIFTVLLDRDRSMLPLCFTQAGLRPTKDYSRNKQVGSIAYSGFATVVYPLSVLSGPDATYSEDDTGYAGELIRNSAPNVEEIDGVRLLDTIGGSGGSDRTYLFSPSFYDETNVDESMLTILVRKYLNGEEVDRALLMRIAATRLSWSPIDRFYYTPVLIMLLRAALLEI